MLRIDLIDDILIIGENGGAIRPLSGQLGAGPVKHRHKVIAYHVNVFLAQTFQSFDVIFNIAVSVSRTSLDIVMDIDRFNSENGESCFLHGLL